MANATVKVKGDDSDLQKKLNSASASIAKWSAAAVTAAAAATAALVKSGLDSADALVKQSRALNTSATDLLTLKRAADLAGISNEQLTTALRTMTVNMGQASNGTGATYDAIKRLGLSLNELNAMSATERMQTLTEKIREVIPASEQAAVSADIFGSRSALAMANLDPGSIATAAEEVGRYGMALSDVQYAQIEQANDALSRMDAAYTGITSQLAAAFAPALQGIADELHEAAGESGFFQGTIQKAVDIGLKGVGFLANGWRAFEYVIVRLKVVFYALQVSAASVIEAILQSFETMKQGAANAINALIDGANNLPGVEIDKIIVGQNEALETITKFKNDAKAEVASVVDEIKALADTPLPSEQFDIWLEKVKQKSKEAAEAAVEARNQMSVSGEQEENPEIAKMREETTKELEELQNRYKSEDVLLTEKYAKDLETLLAAQEQKLLSEQEFDALMLETNKKYEDDLTKIEEDAAKAREAVAKAEMQAKLNIAKNTLSNLSSLMDADSKKAFQIGKAAALANTTIKGIESAVASWKGGWEFGGPAGPAFAGAFMASSLALKTMQLQKISPLQYGGGGG
ncbi:MAG: hypothetical protein LBP40_01840, partial [Campylobacteraceae bacterium]|nr:hypothetical protein [Campylobacteraceae bacterium]